MATATTRSTPMSPMTPASARFCDELWSYGVIVTVTGHETWMPSG